MTQTKRIRNAFAQLKKKKKKIKQTARLSKIYFSFMIIFKEKKNQKKKNTPNPRTLINITHCVSTKLIRSF